MAEDFDQQIQMAEEDCRNFDATLDGIKNDFCKLVPEWFAQQLMDVVEIEAKRHSETTNELGKDGIARLKNAVRDAQGRAEATVMQFVNAGRLWNEWRSGDDLPSFVHSPVQVSGPLDEAIAKEVVPILREFGYPTDWWKKSDNVSGVEVNARPHCPHKTPFTDAMTEKLAEYEETAKSWLKRKEDIRHLQYRQDKHNAENLWDETE